jgi:hypothetical protein
MIIAMRRGRKDRHWIASLGYTVGCMLRFTWSYRLELGLISALFLLFYGVDALPIWLYAPIWLTLLGATAYDVRHGYRMFIYVGSLIYQARTRRRTIRAAEDSGFTGLQITKVAATLPGEMISVRVPRGSTVEKLAAAEQTMRACLHVSDVRVIADRADRSRAEISIIRRDAFESMKEMPWPLLDAESVNIRKPFPFARDEYGRMAEIKLLSRNLIMGGAPDAGKSAALRMIAAAAALDPLARLWMMDAKTGGAEFIHWAPAAEDIVRGRDLEAAVAMLAKLEERVERRGQEIVARGEVFVCEDMEIDVLMIDEAPQFTRSLESDTPAQKSAVKLIRERIWKLIALGRWAGMPVVLSAQKPTADIVPSEFRDLIDLRFGLHCNTRQMSDAIFGDGSGSEVPFSAVDIPEGQPGVGYLLSGAGPRKMRTFYITPKQALEVASRVGSRHLDDELATL